MVIENIYNHWESQADQLVLRCKLRVQTTSSNYDRND